MIDSKVMIKDTFERYGTLEMDATDPDQEFLLKSVKELHVNLKKIGNSMNGYIVEIKGPYCSVRELLVRHWDPNTNDESEIDFYMEDFKLINK